MPNTVLTADMITREALRILHQQCNFIGNINRQYDDSFAQSGAKIGDSLRIRKPAQYTVRSGWTRSAQDHVEESVTLQVNNVRGVDVDFTSDELTLDLDDFADRHLKPAMSVLAANVEADALSMVNDVYNVQANDGTAIAYSDILSGRKALVDGLCPMDGNVHTILNTQDNVDLVGELKGLFQDSSTIAQQYRTGMMGRTASSDFYENTLLPRFTSGTAATSTGYLVNGAGQSGSTLTIDTGSTTFLAGDVITIAGVNAVHPETKTDLGYLQKFVVTANSGASATSLSISPAIHTSGGRQNVSAGPADNAAITGTLGNAGVVDQSLMFHRDAFTFATADIEMPRGVDMASRQVQDGMSLSFVRDFDVDSRDFKGRFDILYGYKALRPEWAVKQWHN